jgi:phosphomannomutase/phosphoglucomutase
MQLNSKIFREYDIRGIADRDLTPFVVEGIGRAVATYVRNRGGKTLALGRDCRVSSERIFRSLLTGLLESGIDVIDVGLVPTPLLYFSVIELKTDSGIMITGSHNPGEHNGFKICVGPSTIHGDEIQEIKNLVIKSDFITATTRGSLTEENVLERYISKVSGSVTLSRPVKVVVDSGNGMGGIVGPELYRRMGCEVVELYSELDGRFPNHHPDPTVMDNLTELVGKVKETGAVVGIGFDGDADRIGAVDPSGRILFGDELLVLYARHILKKNPGATVISEVKASHRLFNDVRTQGGVPIMWKTGHSLIKAKMKEVSALVAGEMSGHMFFNDRYFGYDDAIYAGARLLELLSEGQETPAQLLADLPESFTTPEIRVDCADEIKFEVVEKSRAKLQEMGFEVIAIDGARVEFEDGWGLVRASNTQPVLVYRFEAVSQKRLDEIRGLVEGVVSQFIS